MRYSRRELRDLLRGELRHHHRDFEHDRPQPHRVLIAVEVELREFFSSEREQVHRGEIARRVVEEHVFRARIGGADRPRGRAGVPVVHRGVELQAGVGARPTRRGRSYPTASRALTVLAILPGLVRQDRSQSASDFDRLEELVGDAHRVVGVLAGDGEIGFRIPVGVVDREMDVSIALLGELDHALD